MITLLETALNSNDPLVVLGAFITVGFIVGVILAGVVLAVVRMSE